MPTVRIIHLCREGWRLYDEWDELAKSRDTHTEEIQAAWDVLNKHRSECGECTPNKTMQTATDLKAAFPDTLEQAAEKLRKTVDPDNPKD